MEKSASFPAYNLGTTLSAQCYLGIEPLLQRAASTGDAELLLTLLKNGVSPNFQFEDNLGPLHLAAKNGNTQCAFYLLQFNANPNMISKRGGVGPLHLASRHGHTPLVRLLVDHGADVNLPSRGGVGPLHLAARFGHSPTVELLLDKGATIDARTHTGLTALHLASECGHSSVVCALLDHNRGPSIYNSKASIDTIESASSSNDKSLDVNSWTTVENFTALHVAAHSGHVELLELLLSNYKADVDHRSKHGCTPLHLASLKGNQKCAESLVRYGADIEARTSAGFAPLHLAVLQMSLDMVAFLLRLEVDPNVRDHQGRTPIHLIIEGPFSEAASSNQSSPGGVGGHNGGHGGMCPHDRYVYLSSLYSEPQTDQDKARIVQELLDSGADINAMDSRGKTPLHLAVSAKTTEVVRVLLKRGADPDITDEKNETTALHVACMDNHQAEDSVLLCDLLIKAGAKVDAIDVDGHTPLHFCCLYGLSDSAKILMDHGANIELRSGLGYTPLHVTAHYDRVGVARLLLESGVRPDEEDFQGFTALHHAAQLPTKTMANLLILFGTDRNRVARNGHTAQSIARQLGRPAILGALNRSSRLDADQPLNDV